jgi:hypothetical protein
VGDRAGVNPYGAYAGRASCVGMIRSAIAQVLLLQDSHKQVNIFLKPEVKHSVILAANFHRHVPIVYCLTSQICLPDPRRRIRLHSRSYNVLY